MIVTVDINGREYELATNLRVAYEVQGMNNHKPYTEVFKGMGDMTVEKQIEILYAAFKVANPEEASVLKLKAFTDAYLDQHNIKDLMTALENLVKSIMGEDDEGEAAESEAAEESSEGN